MLGEHRPTLDIRESARAGKYNHEHPSFLPSPAEGAFVACKPPGADNEGGVGTDPTCLWDQRVPWWGSCASPPITGLRSWGLMGAGGSCLSIPRGRARRCAGHSAGYGTALVGPVRSGSLPENIPGRLARGQRRGAGKGAFYGSVSALE